MVRFETENFSLKSIGFKRRVSFNVLTESGTNFGHFDRTIVNEMKLRGNLCS
jgi:hypothetical protein